MFDVHVFSALAQKELNLGYTFQYCHEIQLLINHCGADFEMIIRNIPPGWFYALDHHNMLTYLGVLELFDNSNSSKEKELLFIRSKEARGERDVTVMFFKSNKDLFKKRMEKIDKLKVFI